MLSQIRPANPPMNQAPEMANKLMCDDRYNRNVQDDMKEAIDLLYKFKAGLDKLHPDCTMFVEKMLALPRHY